MGGGYGSEVAGGCKGNGVVVGGGTGCMVRWVGIARDFEGERKFWVGVAEVGATIAWRWT